MITFNVGGKVMTEAEFKDQAQRTPPKPATEPEPFFKGFKVLGHPPGYIAECERLHTGAKPFDRDAWLRKHPGRRIERLYELRSAAETCKELAKKAGWEYVRIEAWGRE